MRERTVQKTMQTIAPTFSLTPHSEASQPLLVQLGQRLVLQATVFNPGTQIDRFRLTCTAWPGDWFRVVYPTVDGWQADSLQLDAGEEGILQITLSPPLGAEPGSYSPSFHLVSANNPDLGLLEQVHLRVLPQADLLVAPVTPLPAQGQPTEVRSRGLLLLGLLAGLGILGVLWLIWFFLRPPSQPHIVEFLPEKSVYLATQQEVPKVGWRVANLATVQTLKLTSYDREGRSVGTPISHDVSQGLPEDLQPFCTLAARLLECHAVPIEIRQPGEYQFELTLIPKNLIDQNAQTQTSSLVTIQGLPLPTVAELVPTQVIYSEMGSTPSKTNPNFIPPVTQAGVTLNWALTNPAGLQDVLLVVRKEDGTVLGGRRYVFRDPAKPEALIVPKELKPFCQVKAGLICENVPTGIREVGRYRFEVTAVPLGQLATPSAPKQTELVQIQPRPVQIAAFRINGREAQPRYLIPVDQGQPLPGLVLSWDVIGGATTRAMLLPSPGTVPLRGSTTFPLNPNGETTLTLQVGNGIDPPLVRSVTITTFDPTVDNPAAEQAAQAARAAQAAAAAAQAAQSRTRQQIETPRSVPTLPSATEPNRLTPAEGTPRFD